MREILTWVKQKLNDVKIWHVHGRFRDFSSERETYSFKEFYIITQKDEDFIFFSAKSPQSGQVTFGGITLSRYTSLVESQLAKRLVPSRDWKVLVTALPKEKNMRLLVFHEVRKTLDFNEIIIQSREIHHKFLAGLKKLVSNIAQNL